MRKITEPVFFINPDPHMALGLERAMEDFHIVCLDKSPVIPHLRKGGISVFCLSEKTGEEIFGSARHLLSHPATLDYITDHSEKKANLVFTNLNFDPAPIIDGRFDFQILNMPYEKSGEFEDKVSVTKYLGEYLPPWEARTKGDLNYLELSEKFGDPFVIQWGRGWAGDSTRFISAPLELEEVLKKIPSPLMKVRVSKHITGQTFSLNGCVYRGKVILGKPFRQINGLPEYTPFPGGTCGNIWGEVSDDLSLSLLKQAEEIGSILRKNDLRGYFGLDFIVGEKVYLAEVNARFPTSVPFYTTLQQQVENFSLLGLHFYEFLNLKEKSPTSFSDNFRGSELIVRNIRSHAVRVAGIPLPGIYRSVGQESKILRPSFSADELMESEEFLFLPRSQGEVIESGKELFRLQSIGNIFDADYQPCEHIRNFISTVMQGIN